MIKAEFSASLLQSHDVQKSFKYSDCCSKYIIIIIIIMYYENSWVDLFFRFLWWIESSEEQHLSEIEIFCNIINVFIIILINLKHPC